MRDGRPDSGPAQALPVNAAECGDLFEAFLEHDKILLAVSGGRDSVALLTLAHRWATDRPSPVPRLFAATVDHGLRADAGIEAEAVASLCATLDIPHKILRIRDSPSGTGIQSWAREVRYGVLERHADQLGCTGLATGHQAEDQAETLLMRLARGSDIDGLTAMAPMRVHGRVIVLRPFLSVSRDRLTATLEASEHVWSDDPSNEDPRFERTAFAQHHDALEALGLTHAPLGLGARRLGDARDALDWTVGECLDRMPDCTRAMREAAWGTLNRSIYDPLPVALRRRLLALVMDQVSGYGPTPRLDRLERLVDRLSNAGTCRETLGGCLIRANGNVVGVFREPGRNGFPVLTLRPGESGVWDDRFDVAVPATRDGPVIVRAFGDTSKETCPDIDATVLDRLPRHARDAVPAFWADDTLIAVPQLGHAAAGVAITTVTRRPDAIMAAARPIRRKTRVPDGRTADS